jgi:hypothetical protein
MLNDIQVNLLTEEEQKNLLDTKIDLQFLEDFFIINFNDFSFNNQEFILKIWNKYFLETKDKDFASKFFNKMKKNNIDFDRIFNYYSKEELYLFKKIHLKQMNNFEKNKITKNSLVKSFVKKLLISYNDNEILVNYFINKILYKSVDVSLMNLLAFYDADFKKNNKKGSAFLIVKHIIWDIAATYYMFDIYNDDYFKRHLNEATSKFKDNTLYLELDKYSRYYRNNFNDLSSFMAVFQQYIEDNNDYDRYLNYFKNVVIKSPKVNLNSKRITFIKDEKVLRGLKLYTKLR